MHLLRLSFLTAAACLCAISLVMGESPSESSVLPEPVEQGLAAFKTSGGRVAVENWTRGGPLENTKVEASEIAIIEKLEEHHGRYLGYDLVDMVHLSNASVLIYLEIQLDKAPVYARFHVYSNNTKTRIVALHIDPRPEEILPPHILESKSSSAASP